MTATISIILIIGGLFILVKGADVFVDGSSQIAKRFNVSERIIGLTLVAFGTSFPELSVSVFAAFKGSPELAVGNVVGSNIFNICGVVGILALIRPIIVSKSMIRKDIPMGILAAVVLFILLFDTILSGGNVNKLTRSDALIFLLFFGVFLYYTFYSQITGKNTLDIIPVETLKQNANEDSAKEIKNQSHTLTKNIALIILGLGGVLLGGELVVRGGVRIAELFGMSHTLIGLTIVAIGTSLPEITTGIVALLKGKDDIAIGNVVGSSVFNVLFILGAAAVITPITMSVNILIDVLLMIAVTVLLFFFARSKGHVSRGEGVFFILVYIAYLIFIIHRG